MPQCFGDGDGPLIISPTDSRAAVKVCGRDEDLISYWYDDVRLIFDQIRDGDFLNELDIRFPTRTQLPQPPFAVRHGRLRDLIRVYAPAKPGQSATVNRFELRRDEGIGIKWDEGFADVFVVKWRPNDASEPNVDTFVYDAGENAFLRSGVPRGEQDIRPIGPG